jgi:hypothetical protein
MIARDLDPSELSILGRLTRADVRHDPYPHIVIEDCLPPQLYEELARTYPADETILGLEPKDNVGHRPPRQNSRHDVSAPRILARADHFSAAWRAFVAYHTSNAFYREFVRLLGPEIVGSYPHLERRIGSPLANFTTGLLGDSGSGNCQLLLDCHIGINTPAIRRSSVRRVHTDAPDELFAALLYFRRDEDTVSGGDLEILRWRENRGHRFVGSEVDESDAELVYRVPYRANTAVIFINSSDALHAVSERDSTALSRRLVNVMGRFRQALPEGLFTKPQKMTPRALGRRALQRYQKARGRF